MNSNPRSPLKAALAVELARAGMTQRELARLLGVPPTTLSTWLSGAHPAPPDLPSRISTAMGLERSLLPTPEIREGPDRATSHGATRAFGEVN
ncbi:MAG: helix-turn-helix transcriptional regulator [Myxococcaceae bacterium]|nr:helix-turn-helix transcriptional regulator [Myxococcaceae bacterium]